MLENEDKKIKGRADMVRPLIVITGPTASGKTRRAVELADVLDGEIISADSRQVYKDMTIGTGKDCEEYGNVKYHLIDVRPAGYKYNLHEFLDDFHTALEDISHRGKQPIMCGGSGMYVESALSGIVMPQVDANEELRNHLRGKTLDELTEILSGYKTLHNRTDVDTVARAIRAIEIEEYYKNYPEAKKRADRSVAKPLKHVIIGVAVDRERRRQRISERLQTRLANGMIEEVKGLLESGVSAETLIYYGLEYKFLTWHLLGKMNYDEMFKKLEIAIHQFAKRQMTWFRGMERRGFKIHWLPETLSKEAFNEQALELIRKYGARIYH